LSFVPTVRGKNGVSSYLGSASPQSAWRADVPASPTLVLRRTPLTSTFLAAWARVPLSPPIVCCFPIPPVSCCLFLWKLYTTSGARHAEAGATSGRRRGQAPRGRAMSALDQSRRFDEVRVNSAFPPIATKERTLRDVSNVRCSSSVALPYGLTRSGENRYADLADKRTRLSESCPSTDPLVAKGQPKVASATTITCKNQRLQKLTCVSRVSQQRRCTPRESTREEVHASYTHD
jgi:hypothetical protein